MRLNDLPGRDVLVGLTYLDDDKQVIRQEQFYGRIDEVDESTTWVETLDGSGRRWLPTDPAAFRPAPAGTYHLTSTGAVVTDPSFVASWMLTAENDEDDDEVSYSVTPNLAPLQRHTRVPREWQLDYRVDPDRIRRTITEFGDEYMARTVILGINYVGRDGKLQAQEQLVGTIMFVDFDEGVVVSCEPDGRTITLANDLAWIEKSAKAQYRLRSTGAVVVNPDYITEVTVHEPPEA